MTSPLPQPANPAQEKVVNDIREFGWHVVLVEPEAHPEHAAPAAAEDLDSDPVHATSFAYTAGVWLTFNHPDLILVGPWNHSHAILNTAVDLVAGGAQLRGGAVSHEILAEYPVRLEEVSDSQRRRYLTFADWANDQQPAEALQLVLPDRFGRWPEDEAYDACYQPLLR